MEKYINQIVAIDTILSNPPDAHYPNWFAEQIGNLPAADVIEVVRGKWIEKGYEGIMTYCSECLHRAPFNNHQELILSNYCPNCGAKMEGDKE